MSLESNQTVKQSHHIMIFAGEASGDVLGASLLPILQDLYPYARYSGVAGDEMMAQCPDFENIFDINDISVMGVQEILPSLIKIIKRIKLAKHAIKKAQPDMVITIDAPDFNFRVVRAVKKECEHTKFIHYVAPSVWAWRPGRAKKISVFYDGLLCLLPFEPPYFEVHGLKSLFVGHPALGRVGNLFTADEINQVKTHYTDLAEKTDFIAVLFGSRRGEIKRHIDVIIDSMMRIQKERKQVLFMIPAVKRFEGYIAAQLYKSGFTQDDFYFVAPDQRYNLFKITDYAIAVSGTAGLELALSGAPHSICYRFGRLTAFLAKHLVKTPYAHLANIVLKKEFIPEFIQNECTAENLAKDCISALSDNRRRNTFFEDNIFKLRDVFHAEISNETMRQFFDI